MANYRAHFHVFCDFEEADLRDAYTKADALKDYLEEDWDITVELEVVEDTGE